MYVINEWSVCDANDADSKHNAEALTPRSTQCIETSVCAMSLSIIAFPSDDYHMWWNSRCERKPCAGKL